jgi:hypothetical protein
VIAEYAIVDAPTKSSLRKQGPDIRVFTPVPTGYAAVPYREDTAYGSRLFGRDDPEVRSPILLLSITL